MKLKWRDPRLKEYHFEITMESKLFLHLIKAAFHGDKLFFVCDLPEDPSFPSLWGLLENNKDIEPQHDCETLSPNERQILTQLLKQLLPSGFPAMSNSVTFSFAWDWRHRKGGQATIVFASLVGIHPSHTVAKSFMCTLPPSFEGKKGLSATFRKVTKYSLRHKVIRKSRVCVPLLFEMKNTPCHKNVCDK